MQKYKKNGWIMFLYDVWRMKEEKRFNSHFYWVRQ